MAPDKSWSVHFYRDHKSWSRFPFIFVDKGRAMPKGAPALLKSRRHIPKYDAIQIWNQYRNEGWIIVLSQWM